jgi:hypothetical protein
VSFYFGPEVSGSFRFFVFEPEFEAGFWTGRLSVTAAGDLVLAAQSPTPGRLAYGELAVAAGPVSVGARSASIEEGISVHDGSFSEPIPGFFPYIVDGWTEDVGKAGAHIQIFFGVGVEVDVGRIFRSVDEALSP